MQTLMLLSALFCADPVSAPDGAIVVLMNSDKLVYQATGSRISHVGLVVNVNDTPMVYEATPDRVRRVPLASYRRELSEANRGRSLPIRLFLMEPRRAFSHAERLRLRGFLDRQLGRRYSVRGYL
ncbi:MAG: hypothetical protein QF805_10290, partial [Pirellulaceae bacterium]|nr:hypothetical protein [Pirellulaceae bacterium]